MVESSSDLDSAPDSAPRSHAGALIVLAVMCATAGFGWLAGPYGVALSAVGATMIPLAMLAVLAHLGARHVWARGCALALAMVMALLVIVMFVSQAAQLMEIRHGAGTDAGAGRLYVAAGLSLAGAVLALVLLAPTMRRRLARVLPLERDNFAHALAVSLSVTLIVSACAPLLAFGEPVISAYAAESARASGSEGASAGGNDVAALFEQVYQLLWLLPVCLLAGGYGVRRRFGAALVRLGLTRPTGQEVLAAVSVAAALAFTALLLGAGIGALWDALGWSGTRDEDVEALMGYMLTPVGALVVGVSAGLGEELLVRGVLQPRLGLLLSNTLFTAMHAGQYGWDMLIVIFFVGTVFGLVRKRSNTTVSALVHGLYDMILILLATAAG